MRIGLISDTHIPEAMPELWPHVYEVFEGCEAILHAGDIYDLGVIEGLSTVAPTFAARGNGDDGSSQRDVQPDDHRLRPSWILERVGVRIGLTHHLPIPEVGAYTVAKAVERHFEGAALDVIVYGDTHVEHIATVDGILCVNPGSATFPHNLNVQFGTVGFLDLTDGRIEASIWRLNESGVEPFDWDTWGRPW
ncbi:MAG: metallophosphoesterase family protein [Acidimicrobiales bacterium]